MIWRSEPQCALCARTLSAYVCTITIKDPHRDPKALLQGRICKQCADLTVELLERMDHAA